ncbi:CRTAC1 family protein [Granulicella aggregans]|uniref:CRTAC1 family protein n=1 Tax=Granulicella aggregans TaxID=474949 RepID=UPI0021E0B56E|nr:CRTAC1 family protein [Granulicella aggregans]
MSGLAAILLTASLTALSQEKITFTNTAPESHLAFTLHSSTSPHRYSIETMTGGIAAFDYDNDGLLDLFFTNGADVPSLEKSNPTFLNRLFHNNGDGTFTDVTEKAGVGGLGYSMGVAAADFDNDGFTDLYVTGVNHNQLLHNNGNGTFTDITTKAGVTGIIPGIGKAWSVTAGWIDYNHDGLLDLFVVNYLNYDLKTAASCSTHKIVTYCSPDDFAGLPNILYRNNGDGTFTDVSKESRVGSYIGKGMGVAFADYDGDGFTDIFVSNDTFPNLLLHNNGDGTFTDQATSAGVAYNQMGKTVAGMGADFRDLDNDGRPDIFHTAMFGDAFPLYRNLGDGQFEDVTSPSGISLSTVKLTGWGTGAFDFDNDGLKDIFTANAAILDNSAIVEHQPYPLPNAIFRNVGSMGSMTFKDVSASAGPAFKLSAPHRGAAFGDFNNDGKIDIAVTVLNGPAELLMNRTEAHNHWIILKLVGVRDGKGGDNRDGLGTQVKITTSRGSQYNEATTATSYNSSSDKRVHFGLGDATLIDTIELRWPTGIHQTLHNIKPDQILTITEHADPKP